ncbi:hypothetical protein pipiens_016562 [Culex pipiens pipiens]|uniref:Uncharacterized protein n=1 Tax=Culex pipiens pipiens TaxID=38569 RepID=A0ABD1CM21_CULPP
MASICTRWSINAFCFSPDRYCLCIAYVSSIKIWNLACKTMVEELKPSKADPPQCLSLTLFTNGQTLTPGTPTTSSASGRFVARRRIRTAWPITRRSEDNRRRPHIETSSGNHWWKQDRRVALSCSPTPLIHSALPGWPKAQAINSSVEKILLRDVNLQQVVSIEPSVIAFITSSTVRS